MPGGVPVATVGINNSKNAGLLAARILGANNDELYQKLLEKSQDIREGIVYDLEEKLEESLKNEEATGV
jgi:5-(carboxyamino)imidazole ribonucleotide mutase